MASPDRDQNTSSRVFLWCVPRTASTSFLKCMTFVEDATVWHEPYLWANLCGPDGFHKPSDFSLDLFTGDTRGNGYDAVNCSFTSLKEHLESDSPGTNVVFVKEMVQGIDGHYDAIPHGFRHSFLIRHPYKVFASIRRMFHRENPSMAVPLTEMSTLDVPSGYYFKELWDLYQHVKDKYELNPIVIDSDDLLSNPAGILEAYCREMSIPFKGTLLQWPSGEGVMYGRWKIQKEVIRLHQIGGVHRETFESTCFTKPTELPNRSCLTEDVLQLSDASMKYYEDLYEKRLKV